MELFLGDLRFAIRGLRKSPLFTVIAVGSLALGIGANSAIFSVFDQVLVRSLGVREPDRLVQFRSGRPNMGMVVGPDSFSYPMYRDFQDRNTVFDGVIGRFPTDLSLMADAPAERVSGELVTGNFFDVLGLHAYVGRLIEPSDDLTPGGHPVAVLSHGFWMRRFGGNPSIVNKTVKLNGQPMTVVGVAPPGFHGVEVGQASEVYVPVMMKAQMTPTWDRLSDRRTMWLRLLGRLKPGVSRQQAEAAMNSLWRPILADELAQMRSMPPKFRHDFVTKHLELAPGNQGVTSIQDTFSKPLRILMTMVGLVLLIACANVANLLMARAASQRQDLAIRAALGARRWRLVRQMIVEAGLLALGGGVLGLLVSAWLTTGLVRLLPGNDGLARSLSTTPDMRVLSFTFAISVLTGLLFGILPALRATRTSVSGTLKDTATAVVGGSSVSWRRWLVAAQVSVSVVLLIGAALFVRTLRNLTSQDVGFRSDHLLTFAVDASLNGYSGQRTADLYARLRDSIAGIAGVSHVSMAEFALIANNQAMMSTEIEGYRPKEDEVINPDANFVGPGFFSTLGVPVVAGRDFEERDRSDHVAIINQRMVRLYFAGDSPLGRQVRLGNGQRYRVIGVAGDFRDVNLRQKEINRQVFLPFAADPQLGGMTYYVRTAQDPLAVTGAIRRIVQGVQLPMLDVKTMDTQMSENAYVDGIIAALAAAFGLLAALLAGVGLYGVIAYVVSRRTREIGIRMALGAASPQVLRLVLAEVGTTVGVGLVVAIVGAVALARLVESQLYGVSAGDPAAIAAGTGMMMAVIVTAVAGPAVRALRIQPVRALRYE